METRKEWYLKRLEEVGMDGVADGLIELDWVIKDWEEFIQKLWDQVDRGEMSWAKARENEREALKDIARLRSIKRLFLK